MPYRGEPDRPQPQVAPFGIRVKCEHCGQEIHIEHLAGFTKTGLYCDALPCLIALKDKIAAAQESDYKAVPEMRGTEQIGVTFERKDAPSFPNARDCEHGRLRGKCPECDLVESEKGEMFLSGEVARLRRENDRILSVLRDDGIAEHESFDARLSTIVNTQMRQAVNRFRDRVLAEVGEERYTVNQFEIWCNKNR
jgi:hypothetical protein